MNEYHKINSIFKRDLKGNFLMGDWAEPVFEYLKSNPWIFTEKVDGTNIRVHWNHTEKKVVFGGRTDQAQMPVFLLHKLNELFPAEKFSAVYPEVSMTLYGEGYGAKIQKGGGNYIPDGCSFVLFDVFIADLWIERSGVEDIGGRLGIATVPIYGEGTLENAMKMCQEGFDSMWGKFQAEGLVIRPKTELQTRRGDRVITKIKCKDFRKK